MLNEHKYNLESKVSGSYHLSQNNSTNTQETTLLYYFKIR
jgi:hypothetical protein